MKANNKPAKFGGGLTMRYRLIGELIKSRTQQYPGGFIAAMVLLMAFSALMSFTKLRADRPVKAFAASLANYPGGPAQDSPAALMEVLSLQSELKSFSDKSPPSPIDSVRMEQILLRIQELNRKLVKK
jgi:hypothetical protein